MDERCRDWQQPQSRPTGPSVDGGPSSRRAADPRGLFVLLAASLPGHEGLAQPPRGPPGRAHRVAADVTETFLRHPAAKITRADACVTPLEADRGVHESGADGDDDEEPTRPQHACHLAQCDAWCRQVLEHVRAEDRAEYTVPVRQAPRVSPLERRREAGGRQLRGGVVQHCQRDVNASDDGHAGNGTGEGRRESACTKTTVEHPGRRPPPIQDPPSVELVEESGVGVWITEPLHRPVPAGRGGIVARSEIAWCKCATVSWGTLGRKQDHGSTGSEAMWPHDGFRGSQVSGPEGLLGEMLPGGSRQRFVTEIGVTPGRSKP